MIFDTIIETERLILRCLDSSDAEHLFRLRSDPEYAEFFGWLPYKSIEQAYDRIKQCREEKTCYVFSIVPKTTGFTVGGICLWNIDYEKKILEIGYDLEKEYRGKGYAFEACSKIVNFAFNELNIETITAFPRVINNSSITLLKKLGFVNIGLIKDKISTGEEIKYHNFQLQSIKFVSSIRQTIA